MSLASLTANYTDSDDDEGDSKKERGSSKAQSTPGSGANVSNKSTPTKRMSGLVSYHDEEEDEEEKKGIDRGADDVSAVPMDLESPQQEESAENKEEEATEEPPVEIPKPKVDVDAWTDGIQLPPEPEGLCDFNLQEKINRLMARKIQTGYDINAVIQQKKGFRNPSIYEKLIEYCEIDEHGTNFPKDLYDGHLFGKESYYEELAKIQKAEIERREKIARCKKEAAEAIIKRQQREASEASSHSGLKRKSKWDQVGTSTTSALPPVIRPAPTLVSASAAPHSSSGRTIPAFGSLQKP